MKFRRRQYITDSSYQIKLILTFVVISFSASIAAVAFFNYFALKQLEALMWTTHINIQSTGELFKPLFIKVNIAGVVFISTLLIIAAFLLIKRTSGPLYRMSRDIAQAATGDLTVNVALRQKDEFRDTAHELDSMLKSIKGRFMIINEEYAGISKMLNNISAEGASEESFHTLSSKIEHLEEVLGGFTVSDKKPQQS